MVTDVKLLQSSNAFSPIAVTLLGIITSASAPLYLIKIPSCISQSAWFILGVFVGGGVFVAVGSAALVWVSLKAICVCAAAVDC